MDKDFRPEALVNYIALLGWRPVTEGENENDPLKSELFSMKELIQLFSLDRITPSNAKLDETKLIFFNTHYLKQHYSDLDYRTKSRIQEFKEKLEKYLPDYSKEIQAYPENQMKEMIKLILDRIKLYEEVKEFSYFFHKPDFKSEKSVTSRTKVMADPNKAGKVLSELKTIIKEVPEQEFNQEVLGKAFGEYHFKNKASLSYEDIYHLLRFVLTGNHSGGPITKTAEILGKENVLKRIEFWL